MVVLEDPALKFWRYDQGMSQCHTLYINIFAMNSTQFLSIAQSQSCSGIAGIGQRLLIELLYVLNPTGYFNIYSWHCRQQNVNVKFKHEFTHCMVQSKGYQTINEGLNKHYLHSACILHKIMHPSCPA